MTRSHSTSGCGRHSGPAPGPLAAFTVTAGAVVHTKSQSAPNSQNSTCTAALPDQSILPILPPGQRRSVAGLARTSRLCLGRSPLLCPRPLNRGCDLVTILVLTRKLERRRPFLPLEPGGADAEVEPDSDQTRLASRPSPARGRDGAFASGSVTSVAGATGPGGKGDKGREHRCFKLRDSDHRPGTSPRS